MSLPEFTTQIEIPKWQLKKANGNFASTACVKVLVDAAKALEQSHKVTISNIVYGESGGSGQRLLMHRCCILKLRTPTLSVGIILGLDHCGRLSLSVPEHLPAQPQAQELFQHIIAVYTVKVARTI